MTAIRIRRVNLSAQFEAYRAPILEAVGKVLASGSYTLGEEVAAFEEEFSAYLGGVECVAVADGTRAISMVLSAFGVGRGDEVLTTPFTAVPTIGAIMETGAIPVFVDIDPDTWLMDLRAVAGKLTSRTRAVLPVHMFGNVVDIPALRDIVGPDIRVVEDAAQAHGSELRGRKAGTWAEAGTFSFYPSKNLGACGDGGAIVTPDKALAERLRVLRNHGMSDKDTCVVAGVNSRLDEIQAAILRVKLSHLDRMNAARKRLVDAYCSGLPADRFTFQRIEAGVETNHHIVQVRYRGDRDGLLRHLGGLGIQCNVYYAFPHHLQPALKGLGYREGDLPVVEGLCRDAIALPLYPELGEEVVSEVIQACRDFCAKDAAT